jgi:hypothetical protein
LNGDCDEQEQVVTGNAKQSAAWHDENRSEKQTREEASARFLDPEEYEFARKACHSAQISARLLGEQIIVECFQLKGGWRRALIVRHDEGGVDSISQPSNLSQFFFET